MLGMLNPQRDITLQHFDCFLLLSAQMHVSHTCYVTQNNRYHFTENCLVPHNFNFVSNLTEAIFFSSQGRFALCPDAPVYFEPCLKAIWFICPVINKWWHREITCVACKELNTLSVNNENNLLRRLINVHIRAE